ncbi:N-acetylmuramic acid 6-phosphate etherase [Penicillium angulare]|uniref:N-acetyl-D-glucosamine kinase n=1 Tax=Penicillium angulare TaxID=116970 RepID=A0A9W9F433_9EURO|nr:N-acetylmuramic acid 6-phosphate etherase [Penicillium angulare]
MPNFKAVWAGIAGVHHTNDRKTLTARLADLLKVSTNTGSLILTSDSALLGACVGMDGTVETGIALIAGTGSVATAFKGDSRGEMIQIGRIGGWGALLGDEGSAFDIGKQALQALLRKVEAAQGEDEYCLSELESQVLERIGQGKKEVLYRILYSDMQPRHIIGDLAKVVTKLGFQVNSPDLEAFDILRSAARSLTQLVLPLTRPRMCEPKQSRLVLSGALLNIPQFKDLVLSELSCQGIGPFKEVMVIDDVASCAAKFLQSQYFKLDNNQHVN